MRRAPFLLAALWLLVSSAAFAQQPRRAPRPGAVVYGLFESEALTAKDSFAAVLGRNSLTLGGAGVDIVRIWKGAFARVAFSRGSRTGTRVFVDSALHVYPLNIPLTVAMTPIEVGGGWRLRSFDRKGHVGLYAGAAAVWLRYEESSSFAETFENTDVSFTGGAFFAGLEGNLGVLNVGVEGLYRSVPKALGAGGASASFNESDLGGLGARVRVGVRF